MGKKTSTSLKTERQNQMKEDDYHKLVERLNMATHAAQMGIWDWDIQRNELVWDEQMYRLYGLKPDGFGGAYEAWLNGVHPNDRAASDVVTHTVLNGEKEYDVEFRVLWPDGSIHWLKANGQVFRDEKGNPLRMVGVNYDITVHKQAEKKIVQMKRLYAILSQVNQTIVRVKDHADLYQSICDVSTKFGEFALAWIGLLDEKTGDITPEAASGLDLAQWPFPIGNTKEGEFKNGLVAIAIRTVSVVISDDLSTDERTQQLHAAFTKYGYHSSAVVPFQLRGRTIGVLCLVSHQTELFKSEEELLLLKEMGGDISFALDTMETEAEHKQAEDALKESEARFSKVFFTNQVSQSILSTITGQVVEVNDACCRLYEYSREELIGINPGSLDLWANPAEQLGVLEELQRTGLLLPREITIRPKSGEIRTILFSVEQINWKGEPCLITSSVDISERKRAEAKVHEQLRRLRGLHTIDQAISANSGMEETLNVVLQQTKELLGTDAAAILLVDEEKQLLECAASLGFGSLDVRNAQLKLSEGYAGQAISEIRTVHVPNLLETGGPLADSLKRAGDDLLDYYGTPLISKGKMLGVLEVYFHAPINPNKDWLTFFEIIAGQAAIAIENSQLLNGLLQSTQELEQRVKLRTSDLLRVNAELEHASRAKDEFLAAMSHELRTPLTGILGLAETLQLGTYGPLSEKHAKAVQTIESSGRHLLELINDILDLSKIEAGKFDIYPEVIGVDEICRASLLFINEQAHKKSIRLDYQDAKDVKSVFADPRRLKQILINLLSNAVKFTPEKGHVTLTVHTDPEKEKIHFSVTDTGIGIAQADLDGLFTPFTQVDSRLNRQYEGTGLGLALVLRLAEMHGGSVQVESDGVSGKGSRFTVSLPWQPQVVTQTQTPNQQNQLQTPEQVTPNSRGVLLLAEDSPTNILAIGDYLQFKGYTLIIASNGMEALVKAEENEPDLILMDIQMPVMDGLEATRRLRADPRFASTPIIALTALAMTGDRERCLNAGANDYLSKPVHLKELVEKIEKLLQ